MSAWCIMLSQRDVESVCYNIKWLSFQGYRAWCIHSLDRFSWTLKPMYSFGKWWKLKSYLMGSVYRVIWVLKALWIFLSETINFLRKVHKTNIFGMPPKFYHRVMYIASSSGHISMKFNMPFKFILRRFEVVLWCLEWECLTFWKIDWNSFKSTYTILWL